MNSQNHPNGASHVPLFTTTNHAFGPPSLKVKFLQIGPSLESRLVNGLDLPRLAEGGVNSFFDTRRGPCVPGSSS